MKLATTLFATALVATIATAPITEARAGSCESGAQITAKLWKEYDSYVKAAGCAIIQIVAGGTVPPNECIDVADKADKILRDMIKVWNGAAKDTWAKIGPRRLDVGETLQGRVVSTGERMFIMPAPSDKDQLDFELKKLDGKAKAEVTVCKEHRGKRDKLYTFVIDNGKDNVGEVWKKKLTGVKGHIVTVHIDAKSLTNTMQYSLKLSR